jgi:integrase/recombinase XerD
MFSAVFYSRKENIMNTLQQTIDEFLLTVEASGRVESKKTVRWYKKRLRLYNDFAQADPLTPHTLRLYIVHLKERPKLDGRAGSLSASYRLGCLKALRRFVHWLYTEGHTNTDLSAAIELPRKPKGEPLKAVRPQDAQQMIDACRTPRDKALLCVLHDTGSRADEMIGMRWKDIDMIRERIVVTGKFQKRRFVFFTAESASALRAYRDQVPHARDDPVWWSHVGRGDMQPLSYEGLYMVLRRIAEKERITGPWNPHAWRHAFCERMNYAGVSTLNLQALMGHESPETTLIYCRADPDKLKRIYDQVN